MEEGVSLKRDTVSGLLNPVLTTLFQNDEDRHSWRPHHFQIFDKPFLRLWDYYSGSQPDENGCMKSRAERERLDTIKSRRDSLTTHIDHKAWIPTPYISFTTSPSKIEDLVNLRAQRKHRGPHTLTVVDPNTRVRNGLPVLHVADEMEHYAIADPYGKLNEYYKDHYVCLWEVTKREIVGHWQWNDLVGHENWYQEIIMPAFGRVDRKAVEADSLSNLFTRLSRRSMVCTKITRLTEAFKSQPIPPNQPISLAVQNHQAKN
jgi:hypothetical protein